jgi:ABC-2 type transport system permease protein
VSTSTYVSSIGPTGNLRALWQYRELLRNLVIRDIKVRYKRSVLGFAWMMINPLVTMAVFWVVFQEVFKTEGNYALYVVTALLFYNFFSLGSSQGLASIVNAGGLIRKVAVPKAIFPLAAVVANMVNFGLSLVPLVLVLIVFRVKISPAVIVLPVPILAVFLFTFGVSLVLTTMNVFYRDVRWFYESVLLIVFYITPIIYPVRVVPERLRFIFTYNPLTRMLEVFRAPIVEGTWPAGGELVLILGVGVAACLLGWLVFHRYEDQFINFL